jgi:hypothetical protein
MQCRRKMKTLASRVLPYSRVYRMPIEGSGLVTGFLRLSDIRNLWLYFTDHYQHKPVPSVKLLLTREIPWPTTICDSIPLLYTSCSLGWWWNSLGLGCTENTSSVAVYASLPLLGLPLLLYLIAVVLCITCLAMAVVSSLISLLLPSNTSLFNYVFMCLWVVV